MSASGVCRSFVFACGVVASACGQPKSSIVPVYDKQTGALRLLEYDANGNGRVDTWSRVEAGRIVKVDIDSDEDGKKDRWEYYDPEGRLERIGSSTLNDGEEDAWMTPGDNGSTVRVDVSTRRDGKVTRTEYYEQNAILRAEEDTDGDDRPDKWETYESGRLAILAFDTAHRGAPDRRLMYAADGSAHLEVVDANGRFVAADASNQSTSAR
jgi:hypothetical protein